ncbi:MAG: phytanoyl-CoA dioxygenase [Deltaproteobacteria bacterium]|nr:phytanoyl-CoA dioxygenase [Deltaproteobacteria bacterium]
MDEIRREEFRERGVVALRAAVSPTELSILRRAFDWSIANPGRNASSIKPRTPGKLYNDLTNPDSFPVYVDANAKTGIPTMVSQLWGKPEVWFMYEQVFLKTGGSETSAPRTPWHQDLPYLPVTGNDLAVVWIPFESLNTSESLEFIVGSHHGTLHNGSRFSAEDPTTPLYNTGELPRLPDIEANRDAYDIVSFAVDPGDLIIFHPGMLHGGAPIAPGKQRSTLTLRYFGEDAQVALRPNDTPAILERIRAKQSVIHPLQIVKLLGNGAPFRHKKFPVCLP